MSILVGTSGVIDYAGLDWRATAARTHNTRSDF